MTIYIIDSFAKDHTPRSTMKLELPKLPMGTKKIGLGLYKRFFPDGEYQYFRVETTPEAKQHIQDYLKRVI